MTIRELSNMQDVEADRTLTVVRQDHTLGAARDLEFGLELLTLAKTGGIGPTLRLYRPAPTVAFGQRDTRLPGFEAAAQACRDHGFEPLVRKAGGRAAAYHEGTLVVDHVMPDADAIAGSKSRFSFFGELLAQALRDVGVQAAVGEIPGEYCPGEFSVHGTHPGGSHPPDQTRWHGAACGERRLAVQFGDCGGKLRPHPRRPHGQLCGPWPGLGPGHRRGGRRSCAGADSPGR